VVVGIQPERIEMGTDLSGAAGSGMEAALALAVETLEGWGSRGA
jgi:hypothetical protein